MPALRGSHDYVSVIGEQVALVGLDPRTLMITPVGVGRVDVEKKQVDSEGALALQRLDIIGYALVDEDKQGILEKYVKGEIGLKQMVGQLAK
jgi:hypothetical protein